MEGTQLDIKILAVHEWKTMPTPDADLISATIVENGTSGGRTAIYLKFRTKDGKEFIAATTGRLIDGLNGAILGSEIRWANNKKKN